MPSEFFQADPAGVKHFDPSSLEPKARETMERVNKFVEDLGEFSSAKLTESRVADLALTKEESSELIKALLPVPLDALIAGKYQAIGYINLIMILHMAKYDRVKFGTYTQVMMDNNPDDD